MIKKRHVNGEKHIDSMKFAEYLRKSEVSEKSKVYYGLFLRNGLHEKFVILVKVNEMYNTLKFDNQFLLVDG